MDWIDCGSSFSLATLRFGANRHGAKNCHVLTRLTIVLLFSQARGVGKTKRRPRPMYRWPPDVLKLVRRYHPSSSGSHHRPPPLAGVSVPACELYRNCATFYWAVVNGSWLAIESALLYLKKKSVLGERKPKKKRKKRIILSSWRLCCLLHDCTKRVVQRKKINEFMCSLNVSHSNFAVSGQHSLYCCDKHAYKLPAILFSNLSKKSSCGNFLSNLSIEVGWRTF